MKRNLLLTLVSAMAFAANAQTPVITFTAEVDGAERVLELGCVPAAGAGTVSIDWGDGVISAPVEVPTYDENVDYYTPEVKGVVKGDGHVKIYAEGTLGYFGCVSRIDGAGLTALDVKGATGLTELYANGNKLTAIDLSANTALKKVYLNNNQLTSDSLKLPASITTLNIAANKLTEFDPSTMPALNGLWLSDNQISTIDLSHNLSLKSIYLLNNALTDVKVGANETPILTISVNGNKLTSLDVSEATGLSTGTLFAMNNNLTELKYAKIKKCNLSGNKFTIATLPTANITTLFYAPQQEMEIPEEINGTIDLSAQTNVQGLAKEPQPTTFAWYTESGDTLAAGTDYTEQDGVFTFTAAPAQKVYCTMATAAFPQLTGANIFRTTLASVAGSTAAKPVITFNAEVDGAERNLEFSCQPDAGKVKVSIDWGDGVVSEPIDVASFDADGWRCTTVVPGVVKGDGNVKVYAEGVIDYFDCVSRIDGAGITALDVTGATGLTELYANGNKLTAIDLSANTALKKVYLNNNQLTADALKLPASITSLNLMANKLTEFDPSTMPALNDLRLNDNQISTIDLSQNLSLKSFYIPNNGLTDVKVGANETAKMFFSLNGNKLTSLDVSEATGLSTGSLLATGNNLTELKYTKIKTCNLTGNKFTIATLPTANITTLTYAPQQDMEIAEEIYGTIDLSAQTNVQGLAKEPQATTFAWYTEDGAALVAGTDYTEQDGVFSFITKPEQKVYCTMTTAAFPKFTADNIFRTTLATVATTTGIGGIEAAAPAAQREVYTVSGARVSSAKAGLYIVRENGRAKKVVIK